MALNEPGIEEEEVEYIIDSNIDLLLKFLKKEGFEIDRKDITYELFSRAENLGVLSSVIYPDIHLPKYFGVYRDYAGGGIHCQLEETPTYKFPTRRVAKAKRVLTLFRNCFTNILSEIDKESACEPWNGVGL